MYMIWCVGLSVYCYLGVARIHVPPPLPSRPLSPWKRGGEKDTIKETKSEVNIYFNSSCNPFHNAHRYSVHIYTD